jgi:histone acetyltransferase 1
MFKVKAFIADVNFVVQLSTCTCCHRPSMAPSLGESKDSCAASCIHFTVLGERFRPEYTHQIFPEEYIPGYRPVGVTTSSDTDHASFQKPWTHELSVHVALDPSCASCSLSIDIRPANKLQPLGSQHPSPTKRIKLDAATSDALSNGSVVNAPNENDADDSNVPLTKVGASTDCEAALESRMTASEICNRLQPFLPPICTFNGNDACTAKASSAMPSYLSCPLGLVVGEYSCRGQDFCLSICDGPDCVEYHNAIQPLAVYLIEAADNVNVSDPSWKVLYLFCKHATRQYSLAGYMTLFFFESPFRKPKCGSVLRICQALVLPPYQRSGHGSRMLHCVFDLANDTGSVLADQRNGGWSRVVEINVEDPAPAFATLRIAVDFERFLRSGRTWFTNDVSVSDENFFVPLKETKAQHATIVSRTTAKQLHHVYELDKLYQLIKRSESMDASLEKRYRLMVKQRLNKQNREELSACVSKQAAQSLLAAMFDEVYREYRQILERVKSI